MRRALLFPIIVAAVGMGHPAGAAASVATGFWMNPAQGWVVETKPCHSGICGYLVGFRDPPGRVPRDVRNPDPSRRAEPLCGLLLMGGFSPSKSGNGKWENGWVYDPETGETYSGEMEIIDPDTVKLRGYVGIPLFGRTLTLTREAAPANRCSVQRDASRGEAPGKRLN